MRLSLQTFAGRTLRKGECENVSVGDVEALIVSGKVVKGWGVGGAFEICGQTLCAIQV